MVIPELPRFGPARVGDGVRFAVLSTVATRIELCLYRAGQPEREVARLDLLKDPEPGGRWQLTVTGLPAGTLYGFRVHGPYDPARGSRCNPAKLLLDPWARAVTGEPVWHPALVAGGDHEPQADPRDSAQWMPRAVVVDGDFDWGDDRPPATPPARRVLYEAHVRGLTRRHLGVPENLRGTYAALAHPAIVEHLLALGVTTLELLPIAQIGSEPHLQERGLRNYWGYNPLAPFAPHHGYAATADPTAVGDELRAAIRGLHSAGIEVVLDVVFNHTAEGGPHGPCLSWRGFDDGLFYRRRADDPLHYQDFTGCGNTLDAGHGEVRRYVFDCLRHWVDSYHVDGFRFDLAPTLGRTAAARDLFEPAGAFFAELAADPVLTGRLLIAEPWDLGPGGYQLGWFPRPFVEWNDRFRDAARGFWRGDGGLIEELADTLVGSPTVFAVRGNLASLNYVTAHDGFTLADLTSYAVKHNHANGEDNRDGADHNRSRNWGVEGPTDQPAIVRARSRTRRTLLAWLAVSRGLPMLLAGDELLHSQDGNNNAYCQDNETSWLDWAAADGPEGRRWLAFVQALFVLRQELGVGGGGENDAWPSPEHLTWLRPNGTPMEPGDWSNYDRRWLALLIEPPAGASQLILINGSAEDRLFRLPGQLDPPHPWWRWRLDTGPEPDGGNPLVASGATTATPVVAIYAHSLGLLTLDG